jgi:hypothetical protein
MNPDKKWKRYTQIGNVFVNLTKYRAQLIPTVNGCLEFTGPKHKQGYGMIGILNGEGIRKMTVAHRVAMRIKLNRELEIGEDVRHTCDNNLCCNPAHLYIRNVKDCNEIIKQVPTLAE